jgi:NAD+ synthase
VTGNADDNLRRRIAAELDVAATMDAHREVERRVAFLADTVVASGRRGLVLGISGGVDSTTAGRLSQLAVERVREGGGEATFIAMRLPYGVQRDEADAQVALDFIRPDEVLTVDIKPASDAALAAVREGGLRLRDAEQEDFVLGNIKARQRMIAQYAVAGAYDGLVVGTDHAAEAVTGFFTKHGDGAADLVPLAGLTKRRVRALARELGVPTGLVSKTPTADLESLVPGRPDEESFGFTYAEIDDFLEGRPIADLVARAVVERYRATDHKRRPPIAPPPHA